MTTPLSKQPVPSSLIVRRDQIEHLPEADKAVLRRNIEESHGGQVFFFRDCEEVRVVLKRAGVSV